MRDDIEEMAEILHAAGWRRVVLDVIGLVALVVALYGLTVVAGTMVTP